MRTIKFDLPIDGVKVRTLDDLRRHFTTEILDLFREGTLERWLRSRPLSEELAAIDALSKDSSDEISLRALCELFEVDPDEHVAALAETEDVDMRLAEREIAVGSEQTARLTPSRFDRWHLEVPADAVLSLEVQAEEITALALTNDLGRQFFWVPIEGGSDSKPVQAYVRAGRYLIQVAGEGVCDYRLRVNMIQELERLDLDAAELTLERLDAAELTVTLTESGHLATKRVDLWEVFCPRSPVLMTTWTTGPTDTIGRVLDSNVHVVREDDDGGDGLNFKIFPLLVSGPHIVEVRGHDASEGPYDLHVELTDTKECALRKFATAIDPDDVESTVSMERDWDIPVDWTIR